MLLPSRHENFGNVVVEALACGTAVLISDRTGLAADLVEAGFGTVLPRQPERWSAWLEQWLVQPRRAEPGAAAWAGRRYDQAEVAATAVEIYARILQTHGQRHCRP